MWRNRPRLALFALVMLAGLPTAARAQTYEAPLGWRLRLWPQGANTSTSSPLSETLFYAADVTCGQTKTASPGTVTDPGHVEFDDPDDGTKACRLTVNQATTIFVLPVGNYFATLKAFASNTTDDSAHSNAFTRSAPTPPPDPPHACDATPPVSSSPAAGSRTLTWCHHDIDTAGLPSVVTAWALYKDDVRSVLTGVTTDGVLNAEGLVKYQATITLTSGTHLLQLAALNARGGEGAKSPVFTVMVSP